MRLIQSDHVDLDAVEQAAVRVLVTEAISAARGAHRTNNANFIETLHSIQHKLQEAEKHRQGAA